MLASHEIDNFRPFVLCNNRPARVICAVPHDGMCEEEFPPGYERRFYGRIRDDRHAWCLTHEMIRHAAWRGCRVDAVRFMLPRVYVDANRALEVEDNLGPKTCLETALVDKKLVAPYAKYHSAISSLLGRAIDVHGVERVLFIDMHNYASPMDRKVYDVIFGTANRATMLHSEVDVAFFRHLHTAGYSIFLPEPKPRRPDGDPLSGGHTTRLQAKRFGVDSLQIEVHAKVCHDGAARVRLAQTFADFLAANYS